VPLPSPRYSTDTVARSVSNPDQQTRALAAVAGALARVGQHEQAATVAARAETVARSITGSDRLAQALTAVAAALARAGRHEQTAAVARSITDPERQAQALAAVAKELAAREDTRQARHVASVACAVGRWTTVLGLVLSLEPSALRVLADLQLR
jgi:hypothetical protein